MKACVTWNKSATIHNVQNIEDIEVNLRYDDFTFDLDLEHMSWYNRWNNIMIDTIKHIEIHDIEE